MAFNCAVINRAGVEIVKANLEKKSDAATATLTGFLEMKEKAQEIIERLLSDEDELFDGLRSGEPKILVQYCFKAKGIKGVSKIVSVREQLECLIS